MKKIKKFNELIMATKHLLTFLEANDEDDDEDEEVNEVIQETIEEIEEIETPEEQPLEVEDVFEDIFEEAVKEPVNEVKLDFLKDSPIVNEKHPKPTKDMNYAELRAYYKKIKEEGNN